MLSHRLLTGPALIVGLLALMALDQWLDDTPLRISIDRLFAWRGGAPDGLLLMLLALGVVAPLGGRELANLATGSGIPARPWLMAVAAAAGLLALTLPSPLTSGASTAAAFGAALAVVAALAMAWLSRGHTVEGVFAGAAATLFAFVYLGVLPGFLVLLRQHHSAWLLVGVILTVKASDIGAYFVGRSLGRRKLIPSLSPGKTWEGLIGGIAAGALVGAALASLSGRLPPTDAVSPLAGALCGAVFALVGLVGDLAESLLKRGAGMKDSGQILPGMGGVLDVLDSLLVVGPVACWMLAPGRLTPG